MKVILISAAYWLAVFLVAAITFLVSNFAGPAGTLTYLLPTLNVIAVGTMIYVIGLLQFRPRKKR